MDASQLPPGFLEALAAQAGREGGDSSPGDWEEVGVEESAGWTRTLSRVQGAVVVVRMEFMADPEGGQGGSSQGTGFVVDAKRGLVVTNRHIGASLRGLARLRCARDGAQIPPPRRRRVHEAPRAPQWASRPPSTASRLWVARKR